MLGLSILSKLSRQGEKNGARLVTMSRGRKHSGKGKRRLGTPASVIFENLEAGANIDDIMNWYEGLDRNQVKAVIEFAARSLDETPSSSCSAIRDGQYCACTWSVSLPQ